MNAYFIHTETQQTGPFTLEELKLKGIDKDSRIWREGLTDWIKASELPELSMLFTATPPPFLQKETTTLFTKKITDGPDKILKQKKRRPALLLLLLIPLFAVIYNYFNNATKKEAGKEKIIAATITDSLIKKDTVKKDTIKKISLDTMSNWMTIDTLAQQKNDTVKNVDFVIGGMPVQKNDAKKKEKKEAIRQEEKKEKRKEERKINPTVETPKINDVKNLQISGGFHKNLFFEAVLEGSIQNPNNDVSYRNIIVTVQFLDSNGGRLGIKEFTINGLVHGGGKIPFKFKSGAPKSTKAVRYSVSGTAF